MLEDKDKKEEGKVNPTEDSKNTDNKKGGFPPFGKMPKKGKFSFNIYWIYGLIALVFIGIQFFQYGGETKEIQWNKFEKIVAKRDVEKIIVFNKESAEIYIKAKSLKDTMYMDLKGNDGFNSQFGGAPFYKLTGLDAEAFKKDYEALQNKIIATDTVNKSKLEQERIISEIRSVHPKFETRRSFFDEYSWLITIVAFVAIWFFIMNRMSKSAGGGQIFNFGKSKATLFDKDTSVSVSFKDVAGLEEAKVEIMEIVDFLKTPKKYTDLGGKIPKGALLVGPPGTGKTLLAKAVAGEANVPFFSMSGSDFVEMFVGVGASRVRDLFKQAKEKAPCIVFIDEIDAIGRARGKQMVTGGNDERESTLNQLLTEMDGFASNAGVIILAATNRADVLDKALLRAGRFDRQIHVELPDLEERKAIFKVHMKPLKLDTAVDVDFLGKQTPGFSGADIANVCNEAALIAARNNKSLVDKQDFLDAIDRIVAGLEKRNKIISMEEKRTIAYHEAGHATVSWLLKYAHPLVKVTIVPRGKALGAAWYLPEERQITNKEQILDEICATLGGRASEDVTFSTISTGALNDLEKVTKQAYAMVSIFGLNDKIGNMSYYDSSGQQEYSFSKPYSEKTAETIDEEAKKIIDEAYLKAKNILIENKDKLTKLAEALLQKEVIFKEDLEEIFGKRTFDEEPHKINETNVSTTII